jgi:hypothetical protein
MALRCLPSPIRGKKFSDATLETLEVATGRCGPKQRLYGMWGIETNTLRLPDWVKAQGAASPQNGDLMDTHRAEALRKELGQLLRKQTEVLESRTFGAATDTDILEYGIRQEIIHEMCNQLANSDATV